MEQCMSDKASGVSTRTSLVIRAAPEVLYAAFLDPAELVVWLPPADMTGKMHAFTAGVGGGYRMSLFYPPSEQGHRGKTAANEDMVDVRFVDLVPSRKIVEAVSFVTADPALMGEMTITITFTPVAGGTDVIFLCENLQPGLRPEDNEIGTRFTLEQLARRFET
jgi:uncharacterized protein YndB with AHSA1/START domain